MNVASRHLWLTMLALLIGLAHDRPARAQLPDLCRAPISAVERSTGVPDRLMQAVAVIESGRRNPGGPPLAWPWTINVEGVGEVFDTKAQAIAAVLAHRARGARSIDVGCLQVNLMYHPDAFTSLEDAFDPAANARYAARFLQQLLAQTGSWPLAVAGYHSLTPDIGADYARKVLAVWARPEHGQNAPGTKPEPAAPPAAAPPLTSLAAGSTGPMPIFAPATRLLSTSGSPAPTQTGRGLDSYRGLPTRLAGRF